MNVSLEKVKMEDITEINRIQKLAFQESHDKYIFCPAYDATDDDIAAFLENSDAYKIMDSETIIGSIFICKIKEHEYDLNTITIHPEYQNKGLGNQAIFLVEKLYPNALTWTLQTPAADERNCHLYEKYGYQEDGREEINEFLTLIQYKKQCKETI